jgi:hypothetical protein
LSGFFAVFFGGSFRLVGLIPMQGEDRVVMASMTGAGRPVVMATEALIHAEEIVSR